MSDDTTTAIDVLMAIRHDLEAAGSPRAAWYGERLDRFLAGEAPDLDHAFDVASPTPGAWTARQRYFLEMRDDALREAYELVDAPNQAERVKALQQHAKTIEGRWDELRDLDRPHPSWSALLVALWRAFLYAERAGRSVPGEKRLCSIVAIESHNPREVSG